MDSIRKLATATASTKRPPDVAGGKRGPRATNLESLKIVPVMPARKATLERAGLEGTAVERQQTFVTQHAHTDSSASVDQLPDIKQGDTLVVGSDTYKVIYVGDWPAMRETTAYKLLLLEEEKP